MNTVRKIEIKKVAIYRQLAWDTNLRRTLRVYILDTDGFVLAASKRGDKYIWLHDDSETYFNTSDVVDSLNGDCVSMDADGLHGIPCEKEGPFICNTGRPIINVFYRSHRFIQSLF